MTFGISVVDEILSITDFHFCFYAPPFYTSVMHCDDANEIAMNRAINISIRVRYVWGQL